VVAVTDQVIRVTNGSSLIVRSGAILGVGPSGPIGPQGPIGPAGVQGTYLYFTPTPPTASYLPPPRTGDGWVDPANGIISIYDLTTGNWTAGTTSIKGPQGVQGIQGATGPIGPAGPTGSAASGFNTFNDLLPPADRHP
jgi:hypothetical protein